MMMSVKVDIAYESGPPVPCGQVYTISDGEPIDMFEFMRPIAEARDIPFPTIILSKSFMIKVASMIELVHRGSLIWAKFGLPAIPPFITRAEVYKSGETHYFSIEKAKRDLLYEPSISSTEGSKQMGEVYRKNLNNHFYFSTPHALWWLLILIGMTCLRVFAFVDVDFSTVLAKEPTLFSFTSSMNSTQYRLTAPSLLAYLLNTLVVVSRRVVLIALSNLQYVSYCIFKKRNNLKMVLSLAVAAHIIETMYAVKIAVSIGIKYTLPIWILQTLILGGPSMNIILSRAEFMKKVNSMNNLS